MEHGGDLLSYEAYYDGELVDYSSNINPLGIPRGLDEALVEGFTTLTSYPDIKYRRLKKDVADYLNCDIENILVGNGAVEIIDLFLMDCEEVLLMVPSFSEYELRAKVHKKNIKKIRYKEDFTVDIEGLKDLKANTLVVLGNPNNPTGLRIPKEDLLKIYEIVRERDGFLLLDEAFFEFCPEDYDTIEIFKEKDYANIAIIRAATKFFSLPGIRLGYACTSRDKVEQISKLQLPWSVNSLADIAGQFIFKDVEFIKDSKDYIDNERRFLLEELSKIDGIKAYETHTNYILIKLLKYDEEYAFKHFLKAGIVIRKCSSFKELGDNHIRIAIKDRKNNLRLIEAFKNLK